MSIVKEPWLEEICHECNGSGKFPDCPGDYKCDNCNGVGYIPTAHGEALLAFLRHHHPIAELGKSVASLLLRCEMESYEE